MKILVVGEDDQIQAGLQFIFQDGRCFSAYIDLFYHLARKVKYHQLEITLIAYPAQMNQIGRASCRERV